MLNSIKYIVYFHQITQVTFGSTPHFWTTMSYRSPPTSPVRTGYSFSTWPHQDDGVSGEWMWVLFRGRGGVEVEKRGRSLPDRVRGLSAFCFINCSSCISFVSINFPRLLPPLQTSPSSCFMSDDARMRPSSKLQSDLLTSLVFYQVFDWFHRVKTISEYRLALKFFVLVYPISKMALLRKHTDKLAKFSMYVHII